MIDDLTTWTWGALWSMRASARVHAKKLPEGPERTAHEEAAERYSQEIIRRQEAARTDP